jgi:hypothetical protein
LQRVRAMLMQLGLDRRYRALDRAAATQLWLEILKPRASMIRFSESRLVMANGPEYKLNALFSYYVERTFATKEYAEKTLELAVRGFLSQAKLTAQYGAGRVGNDDYSAAFPFVASDSEGIISAIKPLRLDHPQPSQIIDHGGQWLVRLDALRKRKLLPAKVLFAVSGKLTGDTASARARASAHREIVEGLVERGAVVYAADDRDAIVQHARAAVGES